MSFLNEFVDALQLSAKDRQSLKTKRGFTDETIDALKFKSLGAYVGDVIKQFPKDILVANKIVYDTGLINKQLIEPNILIPYIGVDGIITKVRPHKRGFQGDGIEPYCKFLMRPDAKDTILTEGEFKAAAAWQMGFSVLAVPGIASFAKNHFDDLAIWLRDFNIDTLHIMFDNEVKDDEKFQNFKPDFRNRYDTQLYSYIMGRRISNASLAKKCKITELPNDWRVDGKADIDGALSQGKSKRDFDLLFDRGLYYDGYFKKLEKDIPDKKHFTFVRKRIDKFFAADNIAIRRNFGKYQSHKKIAKDVMQWVDVSNFTIEIMSQYHDDNDGLMSRFVIIKSAYGENFGPVKITAKSMRSKDYFIEWLYNLGSYIFEGDEKDLSNLWKLEFSNCDDAKKIITTNHCGRITDKNIEGDCWLFENVCYYNDHVLTAGEDGYFWIEDNTGIKVKNIQGVKAPKISQGPVDLAKIDSAMFTMAGYNGRMLLGWACYVLLSKYIALDDIYPFPFLYGEKSSGKTTVCKILMGLFGLFGVGTQISDISVVAITRLMSYYSDLPLWMDEFHNSKAVFNKESYLKSVYNKQSAPKGTKNPEDLINYQIRSQLILSGETIPQTDGVKSRSVMLHCALKDGGSVGMDYLLGIKDELSAFTHHILSNRQELAKSCRHHILDYQSKIDEVVGSSLDTRTKRHTSFLYGSFRAIFGKEVGFVSWLKDDLLKDNLEITTHDEIQQMFTDMMVLKQQGRIDGGYYRTLEQDGKEFIAVWLAGFYEVWRKEFASGKEIHAKHSIMQTIKKRDYYVGSDVLKINKVSKRCIILDRLKSPAELIALIEDQADLVPVGNYHETN